MNEKPESPDTPAEALDAATVLREAEYHLREHDAEYHHRTPPELYERIAAALHTQAELDSPLSTTPEEPDAG